MVWRMLAVLLVACVMSGGCEIKAEREVLDRYQPGEQAIEDQDAAKYLTLISKATEKLLAESLRAAWEDGREQCERLDPTTMVLVLALRNRLSDEDLRRVTVEDLIQWEMDQELLRVAADEGILPHSVKIEGDVAVVQMGAEREVAGSSRVRIGRHGTSAIGRALLGAPTRPKVVRIPGMTQTLVREGGLWMLDDSKAWASANTEYIQEANDARKGLAEFLHANEKEEFGSIKDDVWSAREK